MNILNNIYMIQSKIDNLNSLFTKSEFNQEYIIKLKSILNNITDPSKTITECQINTDNKLLGLEIKDVYAGTATNKFFISFKQDNVLLGCYIFTGKPYKPEFKQDTFPVKEIFIMRNFTSYNDYENIFRHTLIPLKYGHCGGSIKAIQKQLENYCRFENKNEKKICKDTNFNDTVKYLIVPFAEYGTLKHIFTKKKGKINFDGQEYDVIKYFKNIILQLLGQVVQWSRIGLINEDWLFENMYLYVDTNYEKGVNKKYTYCIDNIEYDIDVLPFIVKVGDFDKAYIEIYSKNIEKDKKKFENIFCSSIRNFLAKINLGINQSMPKEIKENNNTFFASIQDFVDKVKITGNNKDSLMKIIKEFIGNYRDNKQCNDIVQDSSKKITMDFPNIQLNEAKDKPDEGMLHKMKAAFTDVIGVKKSYKIVEISPDEPEEEIINNTIYLKYKDQKYGDIYIEKSIVEQSNNIPDNKKYTKNTNGVLEILKNDDDEWD